MDAQNIWHEFFVPRHSEVDKKGRVKPRAILDYLQESAANHASNLGCGMAFLASDNKMWVLSRLKIKLTRPLQLGEKLSVSTYPGTPSKLFAPREFIIDDEAGNQILTASSLWLLLSSSTLRPLRPVENLARPMPDNSELTIFFPGIEKMTIPNTFATSAPLSTLTVPDSGIDLNSHLNNAEYAAMIQNALAILLGETPLIQELQINFIQAAKLNEKISLRGAVFNSEKFMVAGFSESDQAIFHAQGILFKKH